MTRATRLTLLALASTLAGWLLAAPLAAQTLTNAFGGLSENSNEPIDIESDVLVVHDKDKFATFQGNVKAVQGTTTLRAKELKVHYVGGDKLNPGSKPKDGEAAQVADAQGGAAEQGANAQITQIEAKGDVIITSEKDQTTTSDWALYDVQAQLVTVGGNVVLTQGENVLKGDRLIIDLKTGESRFEHSGKDAAGGRIRALFMPKDTKKAGADDAKAKPAAAAEDASESSADGETGSEAAPPDETPADNEPNDVPWPISPDLRP